ncbi:hypothetical protein LDENG_00249780, partial [Lucifuga dentata]
MKELDSARDALLSLCTPGGRDAVTLEVSHLHQLCTSSEEEVRERLMACEARLEELDGQQAGKVWELQERSTALQWELQSLDQALSYSEPQNHIAQLQQHRLSLQNCEKSLQDLGTKVHDLDQEVQSASAADELPVDIIAMTGCLMQQHDSLTSRLSERQTSCSTNTTRCLMDRLQALQQWNHSKPPETISALQVALEEGEKIKLSLQEALSHQQFLTDCLTSDVLERLQRESSDALREADKHAASLSHGLKELDEKKKTLHDLQSSAVLHGSPEETKTPVVATPRKTKRSSKTKHSPATQENPVTEKLITVKDEFAISAEDTQTESEKLIPAVTTVTDHITITDVGQTKSEPTKRKSQSPTAGSESTREQSNITSVETQYKIIKLDINPDSVTAEVTKATAEEPTQVKEEHMISEKTVEIVTAEAKPAEDLQTRKGTECPWASSALDLLSGQAVAVIDDDSKLVPPKRTSNTLATDTESAQTEILLSSITPESVTVLIGAAEDIPTSDVSESVTEVPITAAVTSEKEQEIQKPSITSDLATEQAKTAAVEQTKVVPIRKNSDSHELTDAAPEQIKKAESAMPVSTSEPVTETDIEQPKLIPIRRKSESPEVLIASEPVAVYDISTEPEEVKKDLDTGKSTSLSQKVITGQTKTATVEESKVSPPQRKSKTPTPAKKEPIEKEKKSVHQKPSVSSKEKTGAVVRKETKLIPSKKMSKSPQVSTAPEPVSTLDKTTNMNPQIKKPELETIKPSSTLKLATVQSKTSVVKKGKVVPPKTKSKGPDLPLKVADKEPTQRMEQPEDHMSFLTSRDQTETSAVEETKSIPARRKSKSPELLKASEQDAAHAIPKDVEPSETQEEPVISSSTPEVVTSHTEVSVVQESRIIPLKSKSESQQLSLEVISNEQSQTKEERDSQMSVLTSREQSEPAIVDKPKIIKSKSHKVSTDPDLVSA